MAENEVLPSVVEFTTDVSEAQAPKPLPERKYIGVIEKAEAKYSSKGNKMGALTFRISPDQYPPDFTDGNPDGTVLTYFRMMLEDTAAAKWQVRKICEKLRVPVSRTLDMNAFIGKSALLTIKNQEYQGELRSSIDGIEQA